MTSCLSVAEIAKDHQENVHKHQDDLEERVDNVIKLFQKIFFYIVGKDTLRLRILRIMLLQVSVSLTMCYR